jgi:hypothetical protein
MAVEYEIWGGLRPRWRLVVRFVVDYGRDGSEYALAGLELLVTNYRTEGKDRIDSGGDDW